MLGWKKRFNQPAKQAVRVLAPGDGEAEPGVKATTNFKEPAKQATVGSRSIFVMSPALLHVSSVAHFVGSEVLGFGSPGSASPSPGASTLSARFADSLDES